MTAAPLQFLLLLFAGWVNRRQLAVIDYLKEENPSSASSSARGGCGSLTTSADASRRKVGYWADACWTNSLDW